MDPSYSQRSHFSAESVDLSDDLEELRTLNLLGQDVAPGVRALVDNVKANPARLGYSAIALISKFEMKYWYRGISGNPPELMWRSEFDSNPFPIPTLGGEPRFCKIPPKTVHDVFKTPLNAVWGTVAPQILAGNETFGPVVVWIAVRLNITLNAEAVRDATPDILQILADFEITDVVVEWYEGSVERLIDLPL
ncbi:hypothetical protein B0H15DRAFT_920259 [Mycena belliarum]|uniref:Uncharacterized protein n=1 Tax=Mycena belliarum TaxID=1033014 RepID=A0AAD6UD33_9AGAR|nr:hypothetical protein B0H15DRAFT_920259 [Mycena belliae]